MIEMSLQGSYFAFSLFSSLIASASSASIFRFCSSRMAIADWAAAI
jgi:hypothetical protein